MERLGDNAKKGGGRAHQCCRALRQCCHVVRRGCALHSQKAACVALQYAGRRHGRGFGGVLSPAQQVAADLARAGVVVGPRISSCAPCWRRRTTPPIPDAILRRLPLAGSTPRRRRRTCLHKCRTTFACATSSSSWCGVFRATRSRRWLSRRAACRRAQGTNRRVLCCQAPTRRCWRPSRRSGVSKRRRALCATRTFCSRGAGRRRAAARRAPRRCAHHVHGSPAAASASTQPQARHDSSIKREKTPVLVTLCRAFAAHGFRRMCSSSPPARPTGGAGMTNPARVSSFVRGPRPRTRSTATPATTTTTRGAPQPVCLWAAWRPAWCSLTLSDSRGRNWRGTGRRGVECSCSSRLPPSTSTVGGDAVGGNGVTRRRGHGLAGAGGGGDGRPARDGGRCRRPGGHRAHGTPLHSPSLRPFPGKRVPTPPCASVPFVAHQVAASLAAGATPAGAAALPDGFYAELLAAYLADGDLYVARSRCACPTRRRRSLRPSSRRRRGAALQPLRTARLEAHR